MPIRPTYPGVYIEEVASGVRTIMGVSTSIAAFVGYTTCGPVDKAVRIMNFGDFERKFGGLNQDSLISYAVLQFFLNGGTDSYVVRVAQGAKKAEMTLLGIDKATEVLKIKAINAGDWGNLVNIYIDYDTSNPDSTFNLQIIRCELKEGKQEKMVECEIFRNLSMNSYSPTFAPKVVNSGSNLIKLKRSDNLNFNKQGYSLSAKLDLSKISLPKGMWKISGILNGKDAFVLSLDITVSLSDLGDIKTEIETAIKNANLDGELNVLRVNNNLNPANSNGDYLLLKSLMKGEKSSVQIIRSSNNDVSNILKLGLYNGGREIEGPSHFRPAPNGTFSGDLWEKWGNPLPVTDGIIGIKIYDHSTKKDIIPVTQITLSGETKIGEDLREKLEEKIHSINNPIAKQVSVNLIGYNLHVLPNTEKPNVSIQLLQHSSDSTAVDMKLTDNEGYRNLNQYVLGSGEEWNAQQDTEPGSNGNIPGATEIIGSKENKTGIFSLIDVDIFNLLAIPRTTMLSESDAKSVISEAIKFCEDQRAFFLVDPNPNKNQSDILDWVNKIESSKNAAVFFPRIIVPDPLDEYHFRKMPPSGTIAGVFALTDAERGVWKAPAGTEAIMKGVQGLSYVLTDEENGILIQKGVNCLRSFPVYGNVVWGSRTLEGSDQKASEWKYIPVRRMALFLEESLYRGTQWVVFEPNDEPLWAQIRLNVGAFMHNFFRKGAFQGTKPKEAYFVKCDGETTTQTDINQGIVNIFVGFAPLKPAEFVIIKISQMAGMSGGE